MSSSSIRRPLTGAATLTVVAAFALLFPPNASAAGVSVVVAGRPLYLDPGPIERAGRVFVPLRGIFERLGAGVVYHDGQINSTKGDTNVSLRIGSTRATVNGQPQVLDVAPFIMGATTYVPLRFVAQSLGAIVNYNGSDRIVGIDVPGPRPNPNPPLPPPGPPMPPPISIVHLNAHQPPPGTMVANRFTQIGAQFSHAVDAGSLRIWLDGNDVTSRCARSSTSFSYAPPAPLGFGAHTVRVAGRDVTGARFDRSWSFTTTRPLPPPPSPVQLRAQRPSPGATVDDRFATISAQFSLPVDAGSVRVLLDGNNVASRSGTSANGFSYKPPAPLDFGSHTVRVTGRGMAGLSFDRSWSFTVRRSAPPPVTLTIRQPDQNSPVGRSFVVAGSTVPNGSIRVTAGASDSGTGQFDGTTTAGPLGNFRISVTLSTLLGQQAVTVKVTATDPASSQTAQKTMQLRLAQ